MPAKWCQGNISRSYAPRGNGGRTLCVQRGWKAATGCIHMRVYHDAERAEACSHAEHGRCDRHGHELAGASPTIALKGGNM